MKRKMRCPKSLIPCLLAAALVFAVSGSAMAEDVDVYKANVKNNAHLVLDTSGSMSWPVYNSNHNYAAFMRWMRDPNGDGSTADALAYDQDDCFPFGTGMTRNWWDASWDGVSNNSPTTYDRLDPNRIYLVTTFVNHRVITYTDSGGTTKSVSAIDDIMWNTGTE